jgi:hypothetical protein
LKEERDTGKQKYGRLPMLHSKEKHSGSPPQGKGTTNLKQLQTYAILCEGNKALLRRKWDAQIKTEAMKTAQAAKENSCLAFKPTAPNITSIIPTEECEANFSAILNQDETE